MHVYAFSATCVGFSWYFVEDNKMESESNMESSNRGNRNWYHKMTIKVTNNETGAVYTHKNLSKDEVDWIKLDPNLTVVILSK